MDLDAIYEQIGWPLEDYFGEIYKGLERASDGGAEAFAEVEAPEELRKQLAELSMARIEIPSVEIDGEMIITVPGPEGVQVIKKALSSGLEKGKSEEKSTVDIYTLGSPRYRLQIVSPDYKEAEEILSSILSAVTKTIEKNSGTIAFNRK